MNKLTWILRISTFCCLILPFLFTAVAYHDNFIGLFLPSQILDAMSGKDQVIEELFPDISNMSQVVPTLNDDFQFDSEEDTFSFSINVTSPLDTAVSFNSLSLTVTDDNGTILGMVNLGHPVTFAPDTNTTIPIEGTFSPELITLLHNSGIDPAEPTFNLENMEEIGLDLTNIQFTNINANIGGIQVQIDQLTPNELLESQESG